MADGMSLRHGVHAGLESAANDILRAHLSTITKHSEKSDVLTPWKEQDRRKREVYVNSGVPDASLRKGNFSRARNTAYPHLNSSEAMSPAKFSKANGSSADVWDSE